MNSLLKRTIKIPFTIDGDFCNNVVSSALCGGIEYWCSYVQVKDLDGDGEKRLSYAVGNGGVLLIVDDSEQTHLLDFNKFCIGFEKYIKWCIENNRDFEIDPINIDSVEADIIIQFSIFGEIIYS